MLEIRSNQLLIMESTYSERVALVQVLSVREHVTLIIIPIIIIIIIINDEFRLL